MTDMKDNQNFLERWALQILKNSYDDNEFFVEGSELYERFQSIEQKCIYKAAMAGMVSGLFCALTAIFSDPLYLEHLSLLENWLYFTVLFGGGAFFTILEIAFLYKETLFHSAQMLSLMPSQKKPNMTDHINQSVIKAALEIPNLRKPIFGIDPLHETSRIMLFIHTILYKAKITISNVIIKMLIRRLFGRVITKAYVEFVGIPLFGCWNAWITKKILFETRLRIVGASCVDHFFSILYPNGLQDISLQQVQFQFALIRQKVLQSKSFHPNVMIFIQRFLHEVPYQTTELHQLSLKKLTTHLSPTQIKEFSKIYVMLMSLEGLKFHKRLQKLQPLGISFSDELISNYFDFVAHGKPIPQQNES